MKKLLLFLWVNKILLTVAVGSLTVEIVQNCFIVTTFSTFDRRLSECFSSYE